VGEASHDRRRKTARYFSVWTKFRSLKILVRPTFTTEVTDLKRFYPKQPFIGVGAVLVCSGSILLAKRKNEPGRGKWTVPGGIVELGEGTGQTVIREAQEETGLIVDEPVLIDVLDDVELDENGKVKYHFVIVDFFVRIKGGTLGAASDVSELRWVRLDEVEKYELTTSFRRFFAANQVKLKSFESCSN
jgi:8-oxo-dGTP diphosphatase